MIRVGTDIVSIERIAGSRARFGERFLHRYLHPEEYTPESSDATLAGLWAAKEAVAKALGCGIGSDLSFLDITIFKSDRGAPNLRLATSALERFPLRESSLSISHDGGFAIAVVVLELGGQKT